MRNKQSNMQNAELTTVKETTKEVTKEVTN